MSVLALVGIAVHFTIVQLIVLAGLAVLTRILLVIRVRAVIKKIVSRAKRVDVTVLYQPLDGNTIRNPRAAILIIV